MHSDVLREIPPFLPTCNSVTKPRLARLRATSRSIRIARRAGKDACSERYPLTAVASQGPRHFDSIRGGPDLSVRTPSRSTKGPLCKGDERLASTRLDQFCLAFGQTEDLIVHDLKSIEHDIGSVYHHVMSTVFGDDPLPP
jgi:hypothetical protein